MPSRDPGTVSLRDCGCVPANSVGYAYWDLLAAGMVTLGVGLIRATRASSGT
jgi:hypothetical protein